VCLTFFLKLSLWLPWKYHCQLFIPHPVQASEVSALRLISYACCRTLESWFSCRRRRCSASAVPSLSLTCRNCACLCLEPGHLHTRLIQCAKASLHRSGSPAAACGPAGPEMYKDGSTLAAAMQGHPYGGGFMGTPAISFRHLQVDREMELSNLEAKLREKELECESMRVQVWTCTCT